LAYPEVDCFEEIKIASLPGIKISSFPTAAARFRPVMFYGFGGVTYTAIYRLTKKSSLARGLMNQP
jgi:hypothetical protein